ncbi:hypothetical protein AB7C87_16995 [Natrarchaeobius sp. A-rgal3]|uniref:hypothetical protein n=1 Tax=Natrarchaeobius versutus TaxID=1679078 RepID=UPI00350FAA2E
MNLGTTVGPKPHARQEVSPANRSDARCACGARADGYDARLGEPACERCARAQGDGGVSDEIANTPRRLRAATDGGEERPPAERQADALEAIVGELRHQNAALAEVINTLDAIHGEGFRSPTAIHTAIDDHAVTRRAQGVSR